LGADLGQVAAVGERGAELVAGQPDFAGELRQDIGRADVAVVDEVRLEHLPLERVALAALGRPAVRGVRRRGVVPVGPLAVRQASLVGKPVEAGSAGRPALRAERDLLPLGRDPRVELEGAPLDLEVVPGRELIDPRLADVAERSDVVGVDGEARRHEFESPCSEVLRTPTVPVTATFTFFSAWPTAHGTADLARLAAQQLGVLRLVA